MFCLCEQTFNSSHSLFQGNNGTVSHAIEVIKIRTIWGLLSCSALFSSLFFLLGHNRLTDVSPMPMVYSKLFSAGSSRRIRLSRSTGFSSWETHCFAFFSYF